MQGSLIILSTHIVNASIIIIYFTVDIDFIFLIIYISIINDRMSTQKVNDVYTDKTDEIGADNIFRKKSMSVLSMKNLKAILLGFKLKSAALAIKIL
jgi:hypothetical protein